MNKIRVLILTCLLSGMASMCYAYKIENDIISPSGGSLSNTSHTILKHNMQPYGPLTQSDLQVVYTTAVDYLDQAKTFKDSLTFYNCQQTPSGPVCDDDRLKTLLLNPKAEENYETVGFISEFNNGIQAKYTEAINLLAFLADRNYTPSVLPDLRNALKDLLTVYMIFGDEFLIDALDLRIPAISNLVVDSYINDQIDRLEKAVEYYRYGHNKFTEIWLTPVCCSGNTIGDMLTGDEWNLFNLLSQRMFSALREKASREVLLGYETTLEEDTVELYLEMAAISTTVGDQFYSYGGGQLLAELNLLKQQVSNIKNGLNPLGYDERYVPLNDFDDLAKLANTSLASCKDLEEQVKEEERDYDYVLDKVTEQFNSLETSYGQQLSELTGCSISLPEADFVSCVENADFDLYDCAIELEPGEF